MKTSGLEKIVCETPFFAGMDGPHCELISGCAKNVTVKKGEFLAKEGAPADAFFVVREGQVAIEVFVPGRGPLVISSLKSGELFGWSWLFPPYIWNFDARATTDARLLSFDGKCLREKCEREPAFGYELMKRFSRVMTERLAATRMQLLDVYANPGASGETRFRDASPQGRTK